ncbi:hypothetical protein BGZ67_008980 [Mortierella alpina]|nr:hypothetical protein BGZ67_008980 [Mortierella alpina]
MFNWSLSFNTDHIKLGKKIGHGAQAEIFKAKYGRTGIDEVVIKRFLNSKDKSTKQEVAIIQNLTHRNIVQFYHVHHDMIVMEYVEGGNLTDAIVGKALKSWEVKTRIAKDISLGLAYLHSKGIIHCDIKSANILLTEHKVARICDFGLAMRVDESGGGGGTLQWMAPECWRIRHTTQTSLMHGILEEYPDSTPKAYVDCIQLCWMLDPDMRPAARDVLPDIVQPPGAQDAPEQQQKRTVNKGDMNHYIKALTKTFEPNKSIGFMEMLKSGGMLRDTKTMDWFDSSAGGSGSAMAMFKMGTMYYSGHGAVQDYGEALEWYLAASEAGIAVAMLKISQMYQYGHGVDKDNKEARSWYSRGAEAVDKQSRLNNRIVHHDAGVSEHHGRTMEWFNDNTYDQARDISRQIGRMYYSDQDLVQDYGRAMEWSLKAADAGDAAAKRFIGTMYRIGQGVEQDYGKAMEWYLKASDGGDATAKQFIGTMYRIGLGVEQDYG